MSTQDPSDRAGRDADGECPRLALGTDTAPTSVRPTQSNDEPDQLVAHRWPARAPLASPLPPPALGRIPVPSQQRFGGDQVGPPPGSREQTTEPSKDRPIRRAIPHQRVQLTFENPDLVPEHHDLDVLVRFASSDRCDETEDPAHAEVEEGGGHGG